MAPPLVPPASSTRPLSAEHPATRSTLPPSSGFAAHCPNMLERHGSSVACNKTLVVAASPVRVVMAAGDTLAHPAAGGFRLRCDRCRAAIEILPR
jgi:hypothetical protein